MKHSDCVASMLDLVVEPYVGAVPIRFGMTETEMDILVPDGAWRRAFPDGTVSKLYGDVKVFFGVDGGVTEVSMAEGDDVRLVLTGSVLVGGAVGDPVGVLYALDQAPWERVGILFFQKVGICTERRLREGVKRTFSVLSQTAADTILRGAKLAVGVGPS